MGTHTSLVLTLAVFAGIILCHVLGQQLGRWNSAPAGRGGAIETALFALLGLLLGFSFAGSSSRLEARRLMVVQEANAISTAYQRVSMLPDDDQRALRRLFADYLDARRRVYSSLPDMDAARGHYERATSTQQQIWTAAVHATRDNHTTRMLLLPALNEMADVAVTRSVMSSMHQPAPVFVLLLVVAMLGGLVEGFNTAARDTRPWVQVMLYAAVIAITIYVVLDLEYPRSGLIQVGAADDVLRIVQESVGP